MIPLTGHSPEVIEFQPHARSILDRGTILARRTMQDSGDDINRLLEAIKAGEDFEENWRKLHERYNRSIHAFFQRRGVPREECPDLVQDTFVRLVRGLSAFRGDSRFETWLFQIALNVWQNQLRTKSTLKNDAVEVSPEEALGEDRYSGGDGGFPAESTERGPLDDLLAKEEMRLVHKEMEQMPARMRQCCQLRFDLGLKYREIADLMQITVDAVKAHLAEAKKRIRQRFENDRKDR